jgi:stage IV sporulation protein FB
MQIKTPYFRLEIEWLFLTIFFVFMMSPVVQTYITSFYICYLFILFHELSHMFVASIFGKEVDKFKISLAGVCINFKEKKYMLKKIQRKKDFITLLLIYLAGPLSNLILAIIFFNIKFVFEINIFLFCLNLITIYPLDGYNILKNILLLFNLKEERVYNILNNISNILLVLLLVFSVIIFIILKNPSFLIFNIYLYVLKSNEIFFKNSILQKKT